MKPFAFERARDVDHALSLAAAAPGPGSWPAALTCLTS